MKPFLPALAITLLPVLSLAEPMWNESAIVKAVGVKPISKKAEYDDGCNVKRYAFLKDPSVVLEFRCNRVNVAWSQYPEKGFEKKNQIALQLATRAAAALSQGRGGEIDDAMKGNVLRDRSLLSKLTVGGSCISTDCLLTYRPPRK
ncbi:hypothetical protein [Chromobacterium sphagni]|uniref:Uncharacterized protein n=1 Tax=Chromobacterium sphagni TaxID=1903179 RepID=A0ABX3CDP1_9NEIS|nr:hypothetical protein [Chromobacterium sphagni]OHX20422.1 hypothetical protein BI344_08085 [Chromobacterium sphagni]